jgi:hypothetical protein
VTLRLLPEAQQAIDDACDCYEAQRTGLGSRFIAALDRGYDLVGDLFQALAEHQTQRALAQARQAKELLRSHLADFSKAAN